MPDEQLFYEDKVSGVQAPCYQLVGFKLRVLKSAQLFMPVWACLSCQLPQGPCSCSLSPLQHGSIAPAATQDVRQQCEGPKERPYNLTALVPKAWRQASALLHDSTCLGPQRPTTRRAHRPQQSLTHLRCSIAACVLVCRLAMRKKRCRGHSSGAGLSGLRSLSVVR